MEYKEQYTFEELCEGLEMSMSAFSRAAKVDEGTIARIRKGYSARRGTINSLLRALSEAYGRNFTLENVTGLKKVEKPIIPIDEGVPTLPISTPTIPAITATEAPQNRIVERKTQPIPDDLPEGTIKLVEFKKKYGIADASMHRWINEGINGEKIETVTRPKPTGIGPQHYLTPEQQEKAVEILKRHGKLKS